jgi:hypothetical protein
MGQVAGDKWTCGPNEFNFLADAVTRSCYMQMDACQLAANQGGNKGERGLHDDCECTGKEARAY